MAHEQVALMYQLTPKPVWAALGFVAVVALLLWPTAPPTWLTLWVALMLTLSVLRATETHRFLADPQREQRTDFWCNRYLVLMTAYCLAWSAIVVVFARYASGLTFAMLLAGMLGIASVGVFTTFSVLRASVLFLLALLLPLIAWAALQGQAGGWGIAAAGLIYTAVLAIEARRGQARQAEMLRLRLENAAIAEERSQALALAEHSNSAKSRFLATVSHEMRTPLNGIMGMSELIYLEAPNAQLRARAAVVRQSAEHLHRVIGDLLDLSRLEFGRLTLQPAPFDPVRALREVTDLLAPLASERGVALQVAVPPVPLGWFMGDAARVRQVLHNLLGNALKFTDQGQVTVALAVTPTGLSFEVQDTGVGIDASQAEAIFEPFEQVVSDTGLRGQGTGLGLTIARRLARSMGGDLVYRPAAPQGAVFTFTLDASPVARSTVTDAPEPTASATPALRGSVLIVDDNEVNGLVAQAMLQNLGVQARCVGDGRQALDVMSRERFDAVLMDCQMPVLDGWQATRHWRKREQGRRVPIIGVTANVSAEDRQRCLDSGMSGFLGKPFLMHELVAALRPHLGPAADNAGHDGF